MQSCRSLRDWMHRFTLRVCRETLSVTDPVFVVVHANTNIEIENNYPIFSVRSQCMFVSSPYSIINALYHDGSKAHVDARLKGH